VAPIGARWIKEAVKALWARSKPRPAEALLAACLAEGSGANQWLPCVRPAIGLGAMGIMVVEVSDQAGDEFLGRCEIASFQEAARQGAEPQFDLVEPGAVFGREVEHVLVFEVRQKGASLLAGAQVAFAERQSVPLSHELANVQTPMRVQVVEDPMKPLAVGELRLDVGEMSGEIQTRACHAQIPHDLTRGDDERGDQAARAVTDVLVFAFFRFARLHGNRGVLSLEDLHAGLFVRADDEFAVLIQDRSFDVQVADVVGLGIEVGIVAVEPVDAAVRLQVSGVQDTPDGRARHRIRGVPVDQDGREIVEAPLTGGAIMLGRFAGGERDDLELFVGGKSPAADRSGEHLEGQRGRDQESGFAKESRCCDCNRPRWRPVDWKADPRTPTAGSAGCETPTLAEWNELGSEPASAFPFRGPRRLAEQMALA
jgi:hypothetical protein